MSDLRIIVGENGRRSGLAIARDKNFELRILVLPKAWKPKEKPSGFYCEINSEHGCKCLSVVCYEKDRLKLGKVSIDKSIDKSDLKSLENCVNLITRRADEKAVKESKELEKGGEDEDEIEGARKSALVKLFGGAKDLLDPLPRDQGTKTFQDHLQDFYNLWDKTRELRKNKADRLISDLDEVSGTIAASPLLAPLLHLFFVKKVEDLLGHVRPGYSRVTKPSRFIRGRLDMTSAAIVAAGGGTSCVCTFDEFSLDTTVLQVICAALRIVNWTDSELKPFPETLETAAWLLGHFEAVTPLNDLAALHKGQALISRLPKAEAEWENAIHAACLILEGANGLSPAAGPQAATLGWANAGNSGYVFDVDTASVWQNFVVDSLGGSSGKPDVIHPWKLDGGVITGLGRGMQPDFVRVVDGKPPCCPYELIVDAKYNFCPAKKPTAAVQRQMYVYANESESGFKCFKCRVIYLKNKSKDKAGTATDLYAFYNSSDKLASLRCIGMKFPGPQNVKDAFKWQTYRRRFRKVLKRIHGT